MRYRIAGALGALSSLAVGELIAGLVTSVSSPLEAVGGWLIDIVPPAIKDFAIGLLGTADKPALMIGIAIVVGLIGAFVGGLLARRSRALTAILFGLFGLLGFWAMIRDPLTDAPLPAITSILMAATGWWVTMFLAGLAAESRQPVSQVSTTSEPDPSGVSPSPTEPQPTPVMSAEEASVAEPAVPTDLSRPEIWSKSTRMGRRRFLAAAGAITLLGAGSVALGRNLVARTKRILAGREDIIIPQVSDPVPPLTPQTSFNQIGGITPVITPNDRFYRIDTALSIPQVDIADWSLTINGIVEHEITLTMDDLLDMPMVERTVTLSCVSNRVGGDLVGTAVWTGVLLPDLLRRADPGASASQLVGRSVDDFTAGFPLENVFDGREALIAVGMNGEPLPFRHGFPARLVIEGLYGYVSDTKWLSSIELRTWDGFDGYWVPRGWSKVAPIKTQSRIDLPQHRARISPQPTVIAGVAWSELAGVGMVEVSIDEGAWQPAQLSDPLSPTVWRQWQYAWENPTSGSHQIRARATNGDGVVQDEAVRPPRPDGATGYHTISVEVEEA